MKLEESEIAQEVLSGTEKRRERVYRMLTTGLGVVAVSLAVLATEVYPRLLEVMQSLFGATRFSPYVR